MTKNNWTLFKDDSQVYEINTYKVYAEEPRTEIIMLEYESE